MADIEPTEAEIKAFRQAWQEADKRGDIGNRVRAGLRAVRNAPSRPTAIVVHSVSGMAYRYPEADDYYDDEGYLLVTRDGRKIATHAPGQWQSAAMSFHSIKEETE